jgi:hypothetical protein
MFSLTSLQTELKSICLEQGMVKPKDVKLLNQIVLVSKEWKDLVQTIILQKMNSEKWSFNDIGIKNTETALKFLKVFGDRLKHLNLGKLHQSEFIYEEDLLTFCPKVCEETKKLEEIEHNTSSLPTKTSQQITQIFKELSHSVIDASEGISNHFTHLDLPEEIMQSLKEFDELMKNSYWTNTLAMQSFKHYFSQFGVEEKTPLRNPLVWKLAIARLTEHLKQSEPNHAIQIAERCKHQIIDSSESIMTWFGGIELSENDVFHLKNLDRSIHFEISRIESLHPFVFELKQKLAEICSTLI